MINRKVLNLALGMAALAPAGPALAETSVVTATSPWKLDNTGSACRMQRGFGSADAPVLLQIEQLAPGDWFTVIVAARAFSGVTSETRVTLATAPEAGKPISSRFTLGDLAIDDDRKLTTLFFGPTTLNGYGAGDVPPPRVTAERQQQVTSLIVAWGDSALQIGTGPLARSFAAMRSCTDDLVRAMGLDPQQQASLRAKPQPTTPPSSWLTRGDYPSDLADEGRAALVDVRLMIDATGVVTDCRVVSGYSDPRFGQVTCGRIAAYASFKPAIDGAGQPVASYAIHRVRWMLEQRTLPRVVRPRRR